MDLTTVAFILDASIRLSTPILLTCIAALFSEKAGIFDIGLEGKILFSAFFAASAAFITQSVLIGVACGILASVGVALLHGVASITYRGDQIISGVAINALAAGVTAVWAQQWFSLGGRTPTLPDEARFSEISLPFADQLSDIWILGQFYSGVLSGHTILVYVALASVPAAWFCLFRMRFGLRLRAVGENPAAAEVAGISVVRTRYLAIVICGVLCGLAGTYLSVGVSAGFVKDMSAGRGFIALAALIFAKWRPWSALWACLLFGGLEAVSIRYPQTEVAGFAVPSQAINALPYVFTVVILAGFVGRARPPKAGGQPYVKEF
ncbi:ABC transporter permease [bacterium]|nr:ABC transporter permease [bacterium]